MYRSIILHINTNKAEVKAFYKKLLIIRIKTTQIILKLYLIKSRVLENKKAYFPSQPRTY